MGMKLKIASIVADAILAHAAMSPAEEVCGLLLGADASIDEALPAPNVAADRTRRFDVDPATLIAAHRQARQQGRRVIGHYHSHPSGRATPSLRDAAEAVEEGLYWLVVGGSALNAFVARRDGMIAGRFDPVEMVFG